MGASSSGLLDEGKTNYIKDVAGKTFQSFSGFYRQQYSVAYLGHLHQEVEPRKEGKSLLLKSRPLYNPEDVLHQGSVKICCWDDLGKKWKERFTVLRRNYKVELYDNMEAFSRSSPSKWVLEAAGAAVFTTEEESRAHLETTCAGILNGVKEDSSSVASTPDTLAVYLHLPYSGYTCFLFQQEEERDHFLSALRTCIRHCNLDLWRNPSYERQAFARAFRLYQRDRGCYESWEKLWGREEQVLAFQIMQEVLPWLQAQLTLKLKGKKAERIRQWLATLQATYTLVLEQLTAGLDALKKECAQTASANQALMRSDLYQILSSRNFLEEKVKACVGEEAEKTCSEAVAPYLTSILEALTEKVGAGILEMQDVLHTHLDSAFALTNGGEGESKKIVTGLHSICLDRNYRKVEGLAEDLQGLKERFGLSDAQRLVHSAHLEIEELLDSAVYTLEQFLESSSRLQSTHVPVKMEKAKERVFKQLDYDSRVVQRRFYKEALLEITLPFLTRRMDNKRKTVFQQLEQYIFSDYSSFILVQNVFDDVLRSVLSKEIETVVQDVASKRSNNLLLDTSDLAISQYSLLGQTPPRSPSVQRSARSCEGREKSDACAHSDEEPETDTKTEPDTRLTVDQSAPLIIVTKQFDKSEEASPSVEVRDEDKNESDSISNTDFVDADTSAPEGVVTCDPPADTRSTISQPTDPSVTLSQLTEEECNSGAPGVDLEEASDESPAMRPPPLSQVSEPNSPKISLGSLSEAILPCSVENGVQEEQRTTDRAIYLTGQMKDTWEMERELKQHQVEEKRRNEISEAIDDKKQEKITDDITSNRESGIPEKRDEQESGGKNSSENEAPGGAEESRKAREAVQSVEVEEMGSERPVEDGIAVIRELVAEIIEVETEIPSTSQEAEADVNTTATELE